jgi:hypothetical protein
VTTQLRVLLCCLLPLGELLDVEPITIPLAELFLTKAQTVEMNEKDIRDIGRGTQEHVLADVRQT